MLVMNASEVRLRLERNLSAAQRELLAQIGRIAQAHQRPLYLIGGFVRDLLLGLRPDDFDFVVEGDAPALARAVARELGGEVIVHRDFGTATWLGPQGGAPVDFATARMENYLQPAALPQVAPADITADLRRRDFTLNAIALRIDGEHLGELLDPYGGQADLLARTVRVLHLRSFIDDPTRIFRAVRYEQRLGFTISGETLALILGAWGSLVALTGDRLRHEFELIFREPRVVAMLARLEALEVLAHVHPALHWGEAESARAEIIPYLPFAEWKLTSVWEPDALYYALLLSQASLSQVENALIRLNVNRVVSQAVSEGITLKAGWARPSEAVKQLDALSVMGVVAAFVLKEDARAALNDYLARWQFVRAETTGDDLIALGLTPGPQFKRILWELRAARLDGAIADVLGERELLRRMLAETERL
jgi:tRNA nucleotidyltransferase (CCA-adding enzyme)